MSVTELNLERVFHNIEKVTGFNARPYRESTLKRRVGHRLHATQSRDYGEYFRYLKKNPSEFTAFINNFTITVSDFFRDKKVFRALKRRILPGLVEKKLSRGQKRIKVWSLGCSKGQEPYSLAILLDDVLKKKPSHSLQVFIRATDVNIPAVEKAMKGIYNRYEIQNIPAAYRTACFEKKGDEFKIKEGIKNMVRFSYHDMIKDPYRGNWDLILCRNVFIFFETYAQREMLHKIHAALRKEGILVLGQAETVVNKALFRCLSYKHHIYQKL